MSTITESNAKSNSIEKNLLRATSSSGSDLESVLNDVKKIDYTCAFAKCKIRTNNIAIHCKHCNSRFCTTHGLPEIHGCGEAVRREEKRKYLHPGPKLSKEKHSQASVKLEMKLKQMQQERKSKQGFTNKGKKK